MRTRETVLETDARLRYPRGVSEIGTEFLRETISRLRLVKGLGDGALEQTDEAGLHLQANPESNSVAMIVKHLSGNMISRWTDFLTTDGEKPERNRDGEFEDDDASRPQVLERWERGWACILGALEALSADDLLKTVTIRSEAVSVMNAIQRQVTHVSYHVGQIVYLCKMLTGEGWKSLSIPRGQSRAYIEEMHKRQSGS